MKKLFFTALVAVVAIGGATAQLYSLGSTTADINCPGSGSSCSATYGPTGYDIPAAFEGDEETQIGHEVDLTLINKI